MDITQPITQAIAGSDTPGVNIFAQQLSAANVLANINQTTNGIPAQSLMFNTGPQTPPIPQTNQQFTAIQANSVSFQGGVIGGWIITNSQIVSQSQNIKLDSSTNTISGGTITGSTIVTTSGSIGGWTISSTAITSPDGNMVLDSGNNRILLSTSGTPQILLQA